MILLFPHQIPTKYLLAAAVALADYVDKDRIEAGTVYPLLEDLREVSAVVSSLTRLSTWEEPS